MKRKTVGMLCVCLAVMALPASVAFGDAEFRLESFGDWNDAIGTMMILPLPESSMMGPSWNMLPTEFRADLIGGGAFEAEFAESTVWASQGGRYNTYPDPVNVPQGMGMEWPSQHDPPEGQAYIGGWVYDYGVDPDLENHHLILDVNPPAISLAPPPPPPAAINTVGIALMDVNGNVRSWTWNTGPGVGPGMLATNQLNWVDILVKPQGQGGPGDALHGLAAPLTLDNALFADPNGLFDPKLTRWIIGLENGVVPPLGAIPAPPGGQYNRAVFNWWGVLAVQPGPLQEEVPEPVTMLAVFAGACGLAGYLRRRRRAA